MPGEILDCPPCGATLTLAGWSLHTLAWCVADLDDLLAGLDARGESVRVERLEGRVPKDRRAEETEFSIPMVFSGAVDRQGDPYADADVGLATNRLAFRDQIVTRKVIPASLEHDDGTVESGDAIAKRLLWVSKPGALALATLHLIVPRPLEVQP